MAEFVKGARVTKPESPVPPLTMIEASFVMVDVAKMHGTKTLAEFLEYMTRAWVAHKVCSKRAAETQTKSLEE